MDERSFDAMAREIGAGLGRRRAVMLATGAALAGLLLGHATDVQAGCKKVGKKCDKNKDCCDGATCKGDTKDKKGKCQCKNGFAKCDKKCYDLDKDEANCGACGIVCVPPDECCDGECSTICAQ